MLSEGHDVNTRSFLKLTPLIYAVSGSHVDLIRLLLRQSNDTLYGGIDIADVLGSIYDPMAGDLLTMGPHTAAPRSTIIIMPETAYFFIFHLLNKK